MFQIFPIKIPKSSKRSEDSDISDENEKLQYSDCGDTLKKYRLKHGYALKDRKIKE